MYVSFLLIDPPPSFAVGWLSFMLKSISWIELVGFFAEKFIHQGLDTTVAVLVAWVYLDTRHRTALNGLPFSLLPFK
jgi:hypothetical protein